MSPKKQRPKKKPKPGASRLRQVGLQPIELDQLWSRLRAGAANIAGVRYQLAVTTWLLVHDQELSVVEVMPEGLEDADCRLADGTMLFVQTKERGAGLATLGRAAVAEAILHAARAL